MKEIKFRVWGRFYYHRKWQMLNVREMLFYTNSSPSIGCFDKNSGKVGASELRRGYILMQYIGLEDKKGIEIFVGDILKIYVNRENYGYKDNVYHGGYYLNSEVLDIRGNLKYNQKAIEKLEEPIGKERQSQLVNYDTNLFQAYNINRMVKDEKGNFVEDENDPNKNIKRYLDIEVIGNNMENPELLK